MSKDVSLFGNKKSMKETKAIQDEFINLDSLMKNIKKNHDHMMLALQKEKYTQLLFNK